MSKQQSYYTATYGHINPIPAVCKIGNIAASGIITGKDQDSNILPPTLTEQCKHMFINLQNILAEIGINKHQVIKLNVWMVDRSNREILNKEWRKLYPNKNERPVRQTMQHSLTNGKLIQCDFLAVIE